MKDITIEDILSLSEEDIATLPNDIIRLHVDDGVVETSYRNAALSSYFWAIADVFPEYRRITKKWVLPNTFKHRNINSLFETITADIVARHPDPVEVYRIIGVEIARAMNRIYNFVVTWIPHYVTSMTARELREVVHHPQMEQAYAELVAHHSPRQRHIDKAYAESSSILNNAPELWHNQSARAFRIGAVDQRQFNQINICRGFTSDIDYRQFRRPVLQGYARGLHDVVDSAQESRDASISELQAKSPLQQSDYLNRRLQILTDVIQDIDRGDCGTKELIPWYVGEKDLDSLDGVYFRNEHNELELFSMHDHKHLLGTTIYIRNPTTCHYLHLGKVCRVCLGKIIDQISDIFSIGHLAVVAALEKFIQMNLSAKHLIVSRESVTFVLDEESARFLKFPRQDEKETLVINPQIKHIGNEVHFVFKTSDLAFLSDIQNGVRAEDIQITTASFIQTCQAIVANKSGDKMSCSVQVATPGRRSHLSREFIAYVIDNPDLVHPGRGIVKIDLAKWSSRDPMFNVPQKVSSIKEFMASFEATILRGCMKYGIDAQSVVGISDMIRLCYDIVRECVNVSIPHLSLMVACLLIRDKEALDYRLPLPGGKRAFDTIANIYAYRSLSQMMAYESRRGYLCSPTLPLVKYRADHPFDVLYFPGIADPYRDARKAAASGRFPRELFPMIQKPTQDRPF